MPGKIFCEAEANIAEADDTDRFIEKFFLDHIADSFGRIHSIITWDRAKTYRGKRSFRTGRDLRVSGKNRLAGGNTKRAEKFVYSSQPDDTNMTQPIA